MKKKIVIAMILLSTFAFAGCAKEESAAPASVQTTAEPVTNETSVDSSTEKEEKPTEVPTEEPTPTKEPYSNVIDGYDFKRFDNGRDFQLLDDISFDEPVVVATKEHKALAVLHNDDHFTQELPDGEFGGSWQTDTRYYYYIYSPKKIANIDVRNNANGVPADATIFEDFNEWVNMFRYSTYGDPIDDMQVLFTLNFEDGSSEDLSVFLSFPYPVYDKNGERIQY